MGDRDRKGTKSTARLRPIVKPLPRVTCLYCRKQIEIMPSGLLALHPIKGRWSSSMCRGSGERAIVKPKSDPDR